MCGPWSTETSLRGAYLHSVRLVGRKRRDVCGGLTCATVMDTQTHRVLVLTICRLWEAGVARWCRLHVPTFLLLDVHVVVWIFNEGSGSRRYLRRQVACSVPLVADSVNTRTILIQCVRKVAVHLGYVTFRFRPVSTLVDITSNTFYKFTATFRTQICRKCLRIELNGFRSVSTLVDITSNTLYKRKVTFWTNCTCITVL
jgi:hypothetical protein